MCNAHCAYMCQSKTRQLSSREHMYVYILMWGVVMSLGIVTAWWRPMKWATGDSIMGGKLWGTVRTMLLLFWYIFCLVDNPFKWKLRFNQIKLNSQLVIIETPNMSAAWWDANAKVGWHQNRTRALHCTAVEHQCELQCMPNAWCACQPCVALASRTLAQAQRCTYLAEELAM